MIYHFQQFVNFLHNYNYCIYDLLQDVPRCGYLAKEELRLYCCPQHRVVSVPRSTVSKAINTPAC